MAIRINSNTSSLTTQRRLGNTTSELGLSFERLSFGLSINRASDDAAGLAIADSLKVDARLSAQAIRNINDGISMISIMSEALSIQGDLVVRMQELAQQSANGGLLNQSTASIRTDDVSNTKIITITIHNFSGILGISWTILVPGYLLIQPLHNFIELLQALKPISR